MVDDDVVSGLELFPEFDCHVFEYRALKDGKPAVREGAGKRGLARAGESGHQDAELGYGVAVRKHLIPALGAHRLDKLKPEHIERFYGNMQADGVRPERFIRYTAPFAPR